MDLRSLWRRWRTGWGAGETVAKRAGVRPIVDWEARLQAAGLSAEWSTRLAPALAQSQRELGRGSAPALARGVLVAMAAQAESQAHVERSLRDVREVERLLGAFSGELEKLDEVLEVLSAYAQRMRPQKPGGPNRRLLH